MGSLCWQQGKGMSISQEEDKTLALSSTGLSHATDCWGKKQEEVVMEVSSLTGL